MYIVLAILVFGVLIFVHELGHFIAAKRLGVQVNEFAICMGPTLWKRTKGETTYSLRAIPIGGFCAMEGEDENLDNPRAFTSVKWWRRLVILAAGSIMNFLAGFLLLICILSSGQTFADATVQSFFDGGQLESQGLQAGDRLYKIDGERVYIYDDVFMLFSRNKTGVFDFVVERDGEKISLNDFSMEKKTLTTNGHTGQYYGITFGTVERSVGTVLQNAWYTTVDFVRLVRLGLQDLFTGNVGIRDMSGPVGIVSVISETGQSAEAVGGISAGVRQVLYLAAFIAINLAVMNMLPIPALDGGRIVCLLLTTVAEKILHRRIDPKYEGYLHAAGMILLLGFMALISFSDVFKLFGK